MHEGKVQVLLPAAKLFKGRMTGGITITVSTDVVSTDDHCHKSATLMIDVSTKILAQ